MEFLFGPGMLFRNAVLGGLLVALLCSLVGVYVVLRRLVLLGVALPQASAAGIAAAFWLTGHAHASSSSSSHASALVGSLVATLATLALLLVGRGRSRSPAEWRVGALFAGASAATVLFVALNPTGDLEMTNLLRGELLALNDHDLGVLALSTATVLSLLLFFRREILIASFDPEFARTIGRDPRKADALFFSLLGGAIALGTMTAGPLVVFGFLVLPALAALHVARSMGAAMAVAALVGAVSSVGGFVIAYRVDLPAGPTSVAVAVAFWLALAVVGRLVARRAWARASSMALWLPLALTLVSPIAIGGCASPTRQARPLLPRGVLPDLSAQGPVTVAPFSNETATPLRIPSGNPFREADRMVRGGAPGWTVADALSLAAMSELERRGIAVRHPADDERPISRAPTSAHDAARLAREAGLEGPVLFGRLRRYTMTGTGMLLVRLELQLIDSESGRLLWTGEAHRPVSVRGALTAEEVVLDAAPRIFAEAFGSG
ncbi:MAG TPA: metal ABC transporter permease [Deltaproteobacteria bacterium]|nr:metal ABC transporter permease [Deltaproteobacteria bacterium]